MYMSHPNVLHIGNPIAVEETKIKDGAKWMNSIDLKFKIAVN